MPVPREGATDFPVGASERVTERRAEGMGVVTGCWKQGVQDGGACISELSLGCRSGMSPQLSTSGLLASSYQTPL